jgi:prophage DNA circulation protein
MGRRAVSFSVRGYCIVYPHEEFSAPSLYRRDYRIARDNLQGRLEKGGPGVLQLPTLPPMRVVCQRYRLTEDDKTGGYCTFDMQFVEAGVQPFAPQIDTQANLTTQSNTLKGVIAQVWAAQRAATGREYGINNKMQLLHRFTGDSTTPVYLQALNNYVGKPAGPDLSKYTGPSTTPITQHSWSPM